MLVVVNGEEPSPKSQTYLSAFDELLLKLTVNGTLQFENAEGENAAVGASLIMMLFSKVSVQPE